MDIPEADWKTLRKLQNVMLERLCARINQRSRAILDGELATENDKRTMMYRHIMEANDVIGRCFDDWRRSTIYLRLLALHSCRLFLPEELQRLTEPTQDWLEAMKIPPDAKWVD